MDLKIVIAFSFGVMNGVGKLFYSVVVFFEGAAYYY